MQHILGIDIGGGHVGVGVVSADGDLRSLVDARIPERGAPEALAEVVRTGAQSAIDQAGVQPERFGVALPGVWDRTTAVMKRAVNLPLLEGTDLRALFTGALGATPHLDADVNAAGWAQWRAIEPTPTRFLYLSLGTGVGGCVVLDGQLIKHTRGGAGHFGFLIVDTAPDAPAGRNEVPGCLSAFASGPSLQALASGSEDPLESYVPLTDDVLDVASQALAIGLLQIIHIYAPNQIVLGGGVIDHHAELVTRTRDELMRRKTSLVPEALRLDQGKLPTKTAGVIGAALLARDAH